MGNCLDMATSSGYLEEIIVSVDCHVMSSDL